MRSKIYENTTYLRRSHVRYKSSLTFILTGTYNSLQAVVPAWRPKSPQSCVSIPVLIISLADVSHWDWKVFLDPDENRVYPLTPHPISIPPSYPPYTIKNLFQIAKTTVYVYDHNNRFLLYCIGMEKTKYLYFLLAFAFDQCCGARLSFLGWICWKRIFWVDSCSYSFSRNQKVVFKTICTK